MPRVLRSSHRISPPKGQWFALLVPPLAWVAHELSSVYVAFELCVHGTARSAQLTLIAVSIAALFLCVAGLVVGYQHLRHVLGLGHVIDAEGRERDELLALASIAIAILFTLGVLFTAFPALTLTRVCEARL